jgi:hypothetical protein
MGEMLLNVIAIIPFNCIADASGRFCITSEAWVTICGLVISDTLLPAAHLWRESTGPPLVDIDDVHPCTAADHVLSRNQTACMFMAKHHDTLIACRISGLLFSVRSVRSHPYERLKPIRYKD